MIRRKPKEPAVHGPLASTWRRYRVLSTVVAIVVTASTAAVCFLFPTADDKSSDKDVPETLPIQSVERRDLTETVSTEGTVDYGGRYTPTAELSGTFTWLPRTGDTIGQGGRLASIDNAPVILFFGELPAWRSFQTDMPDGPDVQQLEDNLFALGFLAETPDQHFDWLTREAVRDWRESLGMGREDNVEFGRIMFFPKAVRVDSLMLNVGDQIGPGTQFMTLSDQTKVVTTKLRIVDQQLASVGMVVSLRLPNGRDTSGTVASIGGPVEVDSPEGKQITVPVTVGLSDPAAVGDANRITVTVTFVRKTYDQVLTVPLTALIALPGGGLGVEKVTANGTSRIGVTTGAFAQGYVEITAGDLAQNDDVVAP